MTCLFCATPTESDISKDVICSECVLILGSASQEDLNRAMDKAERLDSKGQQRALKSFIIERKRYDEPDARLEQLPDGKPSDRDVRSKKRTTQSAPVHPGDTIPANKPTMQNLLRTRPSGLAAKAKRN